MEEFEKIEFDVEAFNSLQDISGSEFYSCTFRGIDFSSHPPKRLKFIECRFYQCNLSNLNVTGFTFRDAHFEECKLVGVNWTLAATLMDLVFRDSKLDMSSFQRLHLKSLKCLDSSAKNTDFSDAQLARSDFSGSALEGAGFNGADLSESDFRTATGYSIHPLQSKLRGARFRYPEVTNLLSALGIKVEF